MESTGPLQVLFVLPEQEIPNYTAARIEKLAKRYFPDPRYKRVFSASESTASRFGLLSEFASDVETFKPEMLNACDILVLSEQMLDKVTPPPGKRLYWLQHNHWQVLFRLRNETIDARDYPAVDAHHFNRMGPRIETLEFFPYGFLFRETAIGGPLDAFGFRLDEDLEAIRQRPEQHKLICLLGGSGAWSWFNFHEDTFSELLERRLQDHLDKRGGNERVTVLNFAQGSSVVLHEIMVWLLHVERLRPQIVISHDGCNDMLFGMTNDAFLLDRAICAPHIFELWSQKLHNRKDVQPRLTAGQPLPVVNFPAAILTAYFERKRQLDRMVKTAGAAHIAGLQPIIHSKKHSAVETENLRNIRYIHIWRDVFERLPHIYDQLSAALAKEPNFTVMDFHKYFNGFGVDETLMQDYMHTTPMGDQRIAEAYASFIIERGML